MAKAKFVDAPAVGQPAGEWAVFTDLLDRENSEAAKQFLASRNLPTSLVGPLSMIRPEAERLQKIIDADVEQQTLDAAGVKRDLLRQAHPASVKDAEQIGEALATLTGTIAEMERQHDAAVFAQGQLIGLRNIFRELFDGGAGRRAAGNLPLICNALVAAGYDASALFRQPWTEAFRLQIVPTTPARRRLVAAGGRR